MAKNRNPRRVVLGVMRIVSESLRAMLSDWNQDQTDRVTGLRIQSSQKIENQAAEWDRLAQYCTAMIDQLNAVRNVARVQYARCTDGTQFDIERARDYTNGIAQDYEV